MGDSDTSRQRLAAILAADVAGYSRLMAFDEASTVVALDAARAIFRSEIELHRGRVIDMAGDSVLAVFESAAGALSAALAIQKLIDEQAIGVPADRSMRFRIGVHLGDVIEKADGTVYGDGVNIAARLEGLALPGGVTVSDAVHGAVRNRVAATFEDLGEQQVKNIVDPVHVYRVSAATDRARAGTSTALAATAAGGRAMRHWKALVGGVLAVLLVAGAAMPRVRDVAWQFVAGQGGETPGSLRVPIAMSLAIGPIVANSGAAPVPAGASESLREDLLGGIGGVAREVRMISVAEIAQPGFRERARHAGARYVLEGELRGGGTLRTLGLRLVDSQRDTQVWSKAFELPEPAASFAGGVARRVMVTEIQVAIWSAETARIAAKPTDKLDAMELVVRARAVSGNVPSLANYQEMRRLVDRALAIDPNLVAALHEGFNAVDALNDVDPNTDHERYVSDSDRYSSRAVTVDPNDPRAWGDRAAALLLLGRWNASLEASARAIQLDPYGSWLHGERAWLMSMQGRPAEAVALAEKALQLDPLSDWSLRVACEAHLLLGEPEKAIATCERANGFNTGSFIVDSFLAAAYANNGEQERARGALQAMLKVLPGYTVAQLKAKRYSDHPEYQKIADATWYAGLRKAGLPER